MKASHSVGSVLLTISALGMCACIMAVALTTGGAGPASADSPTAAPGPPPRGTPGDLWADIVVGKADFTEISPNEVVANRVFDAGGIAVDRSATPNRVYVYDSGNNRVLGLSHLGQCSGSGNACTNDSDCSEGQTCDINEQQGADRVLGQAACDQNRNQFSCAACNGDGADQIYPDVPTPSAGTLCLLNCMVASSIPGCEYGWSQSPTENGADASMGVDPAGNLYVPDRGNNRVVRYNNPYGSGSGEGDGVADYFWGQADFNGWQCNRGLSLPSNQSLCLARGSGADVDSAGNLWVADSGNNRVLRFPVGENGVPSQTADLVLGQESFTTRASGSAMDQLLYPAAVKVRTDGNGGGVVYVADASNHRVLEFNFSSTHQLTNGHPADFVLTPPPGPPSTPTPTPTGTWTPAPAPFAPLGLALDVDPGSGEETDLWVTDAENNQIILFDSQNVATKVLCNARPEYGGSMTRTCGGTTGSVGVDNKGNVLVTGERTGTALGREQVFHFKAPIPTYDPSPDSTPYPYDSPVLMANLAANGQSIPNKMSGRALQSVRGVEVATGVSNGQPFKQFIASDQGRVLFWNLNPNQPIDSSSNLAALKEASGVIRAPDAGHEASGTFGHLRADSQNRLWLYGDYNNIIVYQLPLPTGTPYPTPLFVLTPGPIPVLGTDQTVQWGSLTNSDIEPIEDGSRIWLSDPDRHRVLRIRGLPNNPVVDVILGQDQVGGTSCNQGNNGGLDPNVPLNWLCWPGAMALDPLGDLYLADDNLEVQGNLRLLEYDANKIPDYPLEVVLDHSADGKLVGGPNGSGFFEPAFDSAGQMAVGSNAYWGSRLPYLYLTSFPKEDPPQMTKLSDLGAGPYAATFDEQDNLYIGDLSWGRILVYKDPIPGGPTPGPVGGIAEIPLPEPNDRSEESSFTARGRGALVEAVVTAVAMIAVGAWFARRRWRTRQNPRGRNS